jgi:ABC-type antimicrobial peptide transport system permease subunit
MEQVGVQVSLPFSRAFQIAVQGIRIRLGRSLVTLSGVTLGIAFLMSTLTTQLISKAITKERNLRQTVSLMENVMKSEVGSMRGKNVAIASFGTLSAPELAFITRITAAGPAEVRGYGVSAPGVKRTDLNKLGDGAAVLLVLGDSKQCPSSLAELTTGMSQKIALDSVADRVFAGQPDPAVRREIFFGKQAEEQTKKLQEDARHEKFRLIWIVTVSLFVTVIGITNALLMSVTERFREIGTMKCLGALSTFIRKLFLIESSLIGFAGSVIGVVGGALLTMIVYGFTYSFPLVFGSIAYGWLALAGGSSIVAGTILAVMAALYPAGFASRMVPATALRSTV